MIRLLEIGDESCDLTNMPLFRSYNRDCTLYVSGLSIRGARSLSLAGTRPRVHLTIACPTLVACIVDRVPIIPEGESPALAAFWLKSWKFALSRFSYLLLFLSPSRSTVLLGKSSPPSSSLSSSSLLLFIHEYLFSYIPNIMVLCVN